MNKISIDNEIIKDMCVDSNIKVKYKEKENEFCISDIVIDLNESCDLYIDINFSEYAKLNIALNINNCSKCTIEIKNNFKDGKIQYKYNVDGILNICKYNYVESIKEMSIVNLVSENSKVNYNLYNHSTKKSVLDYQIYCNKKDTSLVMNNKNIIDKGEFSEQISCYVPINSTDCKININNEINNNGGKVSFKPNLHIDNDSKVDIKNTVS